MPVIAATVAANLMPDPRVPNVATSESVDDARLFLRMKLLKPWPNSPK